MAVLSVEVQALVDHASYRYDDSLICDGLRHFIAFTEDVPAFAWGTTPWSQRWAQDWASAASARQREAQTARDIQDDTGTRLLKTAAIYAHAEITTTLDVTRLQSTENDFLLPWTQAVANGQGSITVRPGGYPQGPSYPNIPNLPYRIPSTDPGAGINPNDPKVRIMYASTDHDFKTGWIEGVGDTTLPDRAMAALGTTPGRRALVDFLNANEGYLVDAQDIVKSNGAATGKMPLDDFIADVQDAFPGIIQNRAELFNALSGEYGELSAEMTTQANGLKSYWDSPGAAAAYFLHANRCIKYFDTLKEQAAWLGSEGNKAATAIDNLQLAYAQAGNERIGHLITVLKAYKDAANGFTKGATEEPLEALVAALNAIADAYFASWQQANADAGSVLRIDQVAIDKAPHLGDGTHLAQPFPAEVGAVPYDDPNGWTPNRNAGPPTITGS